MKTILILILTTALSVGVLAQGTKRDLQNLSGTFASLKAEDWGRGTFGHREFSFDKGKWSLKFTLALDPEMNAKVFEFRTFGNYKIVGKSKVVDAYNAVFYEHKKFVTLLTDNKELIQGFGLMDCNLTPFKEKDISENGCALWPAVKACSEDHDLLALDKQGQLYFGKRPEDNNMCTSDRRPTSLLPPVKKISNETF